MHSYQIAFDDIILLALVLTSILPSLSPALCFSSFEKESQSLAGEQDSISGCYLEQYGITETLLVTHTHTEQCFRVNCAELSYVFVIGRIKLSLGNMQAVLFCEKLNNCPSSNRIKSRGKVRQQRTHTELCGVMDRVAVVF